MAKTKAKKTKAKFKIGDFVQDIYDLSQEKEVVKVEEDSYSKETVYLMRDGGTIRESRLIAYNEAIAVLSRQINSTGRLTNSLYNSVNKLKERGFWKAVWRFFYFN